MGYQPSATRYEAMRYNRCGRSGLKLPAVSLGWWYNFGAVDPLENTNVAKRAEQALTVERLMGQWKQGWQGAKPPGTSLAGKN